MKTDNNYKKNFLIIRLSSMGDIVLSTALIRCIKNNYKNANIDFVLKKQFADILKHNPNIRSIIEYDKQNPNSMNEIKQKLISQNYFVIDLQNNRTSRKIRRSAGQKIVKFDKKRWQKIALVLFKKNLFDGKNIAERYIETASKFGIKNDAKGLEVWLPNEKQYSTKTANNELTISIAPFAMHKTKQWLPEYFVELAGKLSEKYSCQFNLLGGNDAIEICQLIASNLPTKANNYAGKTSILDVASILKNSTILISNDTGIMHIGAARKVPTVAIYGSTTTELGFTPYQTEHKICEVKLKCRPCSHIGKKKCPKKHFNCMKMLTPDIVFQQVEDLIALHEK